MLLVYKKYGLPIFNYFHNEKRRWFDWLLPSVYIGCHSESDLPGLFRIPRHSIINDLTVSEDKLFAKLRTQTRRGIRCAQRDQLFTLETDTPLDEFHPFARHFASQRSLSLFEMDVVGQLSPNNYKIYTMRHGSRIVVSHLYFISAQEKPLRATLYISAVDLKFKEENPALHRKVGDANRLMHWQSMRDFKAMGVDLYDWGGYSQDQSDKQLQGIDQFKVSFGGEIIPVSNYHSPSYHLFKYMRNVTLSLGLARVN